MLEDISHLQQLQILLPTMMVALGQLEVMTMIFLLTQTVHFQKKEHFGITAVQKPIL